MEGKKLLPAGRGRLVGSSSSPRSGVTVHPYSGVDPEPEFCSNPDDRSTIALNRARAAVVRESDAIRRGRQLAQQQFQDAFGMAKASTRQQQQRGGWISWSSRRSGKDSETRTAGKQYMAHIPTGNMVPNLVQVKPMRSKQRTDADAARDSDTLEMQMRGQNSGEGKAEELDPDGASGSRKRQLELKSFV